MAKVKYPTNDKEKLDDIEDFCQTVMDNLERYKPGQYPDMHNLLQRILITIRKPYEEETTIKKK